MRVAPYLGYRDSGYAGPDGVRDLSIGVDEYIDDGDPKVSRGARVTEVILVLPTAATIAAVTARVRSALGAPDEACHPAFSYPRSPAPEFVRRLSWRGDRFGVVIGMAFGNPDRLAQRPAGWFAIGETPSVRGMGLATMPCPTRAAETP